MSKTVIIPLFPLNIVLLPNEKISLHIFEKKYRKMISNCIDKNKDFGIILRGIENNHKIGCTAEIIDVVYEYDSGEYDITVVGKKRFSIVETETKEELLLSKALILPDNKYKTRKKLLEDVKNKYVNILLNNNLTKNFEVEMNRSMSYDFTKKIILPNNIKQIFLEQETENERLVFLNEIFDKVLEETKYNKSKTYN